MASAPGDEVIPRSSVKFEQIKVRPIPTYRPLREPDGSYEHLTREDIVKELRMITALPLNERGRDLLPPALPRITCRYDRYSVVDQAWFGKFSKWYGHELWHLDLTYRKEYWDCDDFSTSLNAMADLALLESREHPAPQLIGRLIIRQVHAWASTPAGGTHEIVIFRSEAGWQVMEPQNQHIASLWDYPNRQHIREILFN